MQEVSRPGPTRPRFERPPVQVGDYLHSEQDLFRVERLKAGRALVEDCKTDVLIDLPVEQLESLAPVEPAR